MIRVELDPAHMSSWRTRQKNLQLKQSVGRESDHRGRVLLSNLWKKRKKQSGQEPTKRKATSINRRNSTFHVRVSRRLRYVMTPEASEATLKWSVKSLRMRKKWRVAKWVLVQDSIKQKHLIFILRLTFLWNNSWNVRGRALDLRWIDFKIRLWGVSSVPDNTNLVLWAKSLIAHLQSQALGHLSLENVHSWLMRSKAVKYLHQGNTQTSNWTEHLQKQ